MTLAMQDTTSIVLPKPRAAALPARGAQTPACRPCPTSFNWVHDNGHTCEQPPNFRRGTIEDPDNDGTGFVTTTLAPVNPWLGASENFTIMRVTISYNWRATNGYSNVSGITSGPWVWGIQK